MVIRSTPQSLHDLFLAYADDCRGYSPVYEHITAAIAGDPEVQALSASGMPGQPPPNLICAATHYLLLSGVQHDLARYYPSVTAAAAPIDGGLYPAFRDFCLRNAGAIRPLVASRLVQTNEVGRSACLLPGYAEVSRREDGRPLALIDFGCSAGLNLLFDRFGYDYAHPEALERGRLRWGDASSPVQLWCELRGDVTPSLQPGAPVAGWRAGVDLNPIDVTDPDALLWLRALVWPEHREREATLVAAAGLMREHPQRLIKGDGVELLPSLIGRGAGRPRVGCLLQLRLAPANARSAASVLRGAGRGIAQTARLRRLDGWPDAGDEDRVDDVARRRLQARDAGRVHGARPVDEVRSIFIAIGPFTVE